MDSRRLCSQQREGRFVGNNARRTTLSARPIWVPAAKPLLHWNVVGAVLTATRRCQSITTLQAPRGAVAARGTATASLSPSTSEEDAAAAAAHEHHHDQSLPKGDFTKFVRYFRQASPYIEGHRGRTFVIVVPGEVGCGLRSPDSKHAACTRPLGFRGTRVNRQGKDARRRWLPGGLRIPDDALPTVRLLRDGGGEGALIVTSCTWRGRGHRPTLCRCPPPAGMLQPSPAAICAERRGVTAWCGPGHAL